MIKAAVLLLALSVLSPAARALAGTDGVTVDYVRDVRPIFQQRCCECHGEKKQKSGLRLDIKAAALKGGDSHAPDIVPGNAVASPLIQLVASADPDERMPSKGEPLTAGQIDVLRRWIDQGAVWPDGADLVRADDGRDHWAFKPLSHQTPPSTKDLDWPSNDVDRFVLARLENEGLRPSPQADRRTLVRRVYFDVIGLPPSPGEVEAFVADKDPQAYEKLVDRLLASPRFGECWARHWLDVVRFAESDGFEMNAARANAWPYRDYVIDAFNRDEPYDRFIREQLAGDALGEDAAMGFLVGGAVDRVKSPDPVLTANQRADELNDMVSTTAAAFLGLTVNCARCHDHKFDPIPTRDYYGLTAVFQGVKHGERQLAGQGSAEDARRLAALRAELAPVEAKLAQFRPRARLGRVVLVDDSAGPASADKPGVTQVEQPANGAPVTYSPGRERGQADDPGDARRLPNLGASYRYWVARPGKPKDLLAWEPRLAGRFRIWVSWGVFSTHTRDARYVLDRDGNLATTADQTEIAKADQTHFADGTPAIAEQRRWSGFRPAGVYDLNLASTILLRSGDSGGPTVADVIAFEEITDDAGDGAAGSGAAGLGAAGLDELGAMGKRTRLPVEPLAVGDSTGKRVRLPMAPIQNPMAPIQYPMAPIQYPMAPIQYPMAPIQYPMAPTQYLGAATTQKTATPAGSLHLRPPVTHRANEDTFEPVTAKFVRFTITASSSAEPCLDELEVFSTGEGPQDAGSHNVALASAGAKVTVSGTYANGANPKHRPGHLIDGRYGNDFSWISNQAGAGWAQVELAKPERINRVVWSRDRGDGPGRVYDDRLAIGYRIDVSADGTTWKAVASSADRLGPAYLKRAADLPTLSGVPVEQAAAVAQLNAQRTRLADEIQKLSSRPMVYAGVFVQPGPTRRNNRGDPMQPREIVAPGALSSIGTPLTLPADMPEQERRLALADWIADPRNPLTARVIVNRLWHYHFGTGIVDTPSDFGRNGSPPTHPELLDWLAGQLVTHGWSLKHVHRLILLSRTYQQAAAMDDAAFKADSTSRLLWRFPPRRLEAEALRDALLAVSGKLDLRMGGPGFDLFEPNNNYVKVYTSKAAFGPDEFRRMVYQSKPRMVLDDCFGTFDCPDAGQPAPKRTSSVTPLQALNLLNSNFTMQQAGYFAERLKTEAGADPAAQAGRAFLLAFGRAPSAAESADSVRLISENGLVVFCRALFNANEFIRVE